jgi:hypothetical protein
LVTKQGLTHIRTPRPRIPPRLRIATVPPRLSQVRRHAVPLPTVAAQDLGTCLPARGRRVPLDIDVWEESAQLLPWVSSVSARPWLPAQERRSSARPPAWWEEGAALARSYGSRRVNLRYRRHGEGHHHDAQVRVARDRRENDERGLDGGIN